MTKVSALLTTKGVYARRRCRSCRRLFTPRPGGRPAVFCNASCKQRAYKMRKKEHASPATPPTVQEIGVLRRARYFGGSVNRTIFTPENAKDLFQKCGGVRPLEETDFDKVAEELDWIALWCISICQQRMAPTPGEDQKWFLKNVRHIRPLLADFGVKGRIDHLNRPETINLISMLSFPSDAALPCDDLYLRHKMAVEVGAREVLSGGSAIRGVLRGLQMMMVRAEWAAAVAERGKGAPRKAPSEEESLVAALHALYARVTGDNRWNTTNVVTGTQGGPFVNFVMAVTTHVRDNLDAVEPPPPAPLAKNLQALSTALTRRVITRIRSVRKRLKA